MLEVMVQKGDLHATVCKILIQPQATNHSITYLLVHLSLLTLRVNSFWLPELKKQVALQTKQKIGKGQQGSRLFSKVRNEFGCGSKLRWV